MPKLLAHFDVELPGQCLIAMPKKNIVVRSTMNGFDIKIQLVPNKSFRFKKKSETYWTCGLERAQIIVSRNEAELPPPVLPNERGQLDYTVQTEYFLNKTKEFGHVAREAINRIIRFFRFSLKTPLLQEFPDGHPHFSNPKWTNAKNKVVGKSGIVITSIRVPGLHGELGVKKLNSKMLGALESFLTDPIAPTLTEQLLSDAQSAWFEDNLRRAILELAIACEVAVKRRFFADDSPAGAAFDYLEDKAQVNVRVLELMDRVALEAFGRSFKAQHPNDYLNIDYLFRCRNKVAHRGELSFRDDTGKETTVNKKVVATWCNSAVVLKEWLSSL